MCSRLLSSILIVHSNSQSLQEDVGIINSSFLPRSLQFMIVQSLYDTQYK